MPRGVFLRWSQRELFSFSLFFSPSRSNEMCAHIRSTFVTPWTRKSDCLPFPSVPHREKSRRLFFREWRIDQVRSRVVFNRRTWIFRCFLDGIELVHALPLFFIFFTLVSHNSVGLYSQLKRSLCPFQKTKNAVWIELTDGQIDCVFFAVRTCFSYIFFRRTRDARMPSVHVLVCICDDARHADYTTVPFIQIL